jgi:hypothetical protein
VPPKSFEDESGGQTRRKLNYKRTFSFNPPNENDKKLTTQEDQFFSDGFNDIDLKVENSPIKGNKE